MNKKKFIIIALFVTVTALLSFIPKQIPIAQKHSLKKIVIDAGHGGKDYGATGKFSNEKDVSLSVALKLQELLQQQLPEVEIYMTRTTDVYDNVKEKANKANAAGGDLFVCIHCNSSESYHKVITGYKTVTVKKHGKKRKEQVPIYSTVRVSNDVKGTETYIWGISKNGSKAKALSENESMFMDSALISEMKDFDPDDPSKMVLYSLKTQQYLDRSFNLANTIEDEFVKGGRVSRGAKQRNEKGIWVLQAVAMPAVLVETGFISNDEEEKYLNSPTGQTEIAQSIINALKRYKYSLENKISHSTGN